MKNDVIVCRCEEVLLHDIIDALHSGAETTKEVKLRTRAGMGICQGKTCRPMLERIVAAETGDEIPKTSALTQHFPVRPIMLGELAQLAQKNKNKKCER